MWEDISSERGQYGWVRMSCDEPGCDATVEGNPSRDASWRDGWVDELTIGIARGYCPAHAEPAST